MLFAIALTVPMYGPATLVDESGRGVVLVVALPAILTAAAWVALWRKCARGGRLSGCVAWACVWALAAFCVVSILTIGLFVAPAAALLGCAVLLTPSGSPPANRLV